MPKFKTLKDHVYDYIAEQIMEGRLRPSEKISEAAICEELSISRTPVREALIQLAGEEILENVPRKGFIIRHVDLKKARELYEVIGQLDGLAAYNACAGLTEQDFKDMDFYIESMDLAIRSENLAMYYRQQLEFHQVYISKCSNQTLISEIERLRNKFIKKSYTTDPKGEIIRILLATNAEHREIYTLLKDRKKEQVADYIAHTHWSPERSRFDLMGDEA